MLSCPRRDWPHVHVGPRWRRKTAIASKHFEEQDSWGPDRPWTGIRAHPSPGDTGPRAFLPPSLGPLCPTSDPPHPRNRREKIHRDPRRDRRSLKRDRFPPPPPPPSPQFFRHFTREKASFGKILRLRFHRLKTRSYIYIVFLSCIFSHAEIFILRRISRRGISLSLKVVLETTFVILPSLVSASWSDEILFHTRFVRCEKYSSIDLALIINRRKNFSKLSLIYTFFSK